MIKMLGGYVECQARREQLVKLMDIDRFSSLIHSHGNRILNILLYPILI